MTISNGYATLLDIKPRLNLTNSTYDNELEGVIEAVSRSIDEEYKRQFYASSTTRYYTADAPGRVIIDDLLSLTTLATDDNADGTFETTWTSSDYILAPYNSTPYLWIEKAVLGNRLFPTHLRGVAVTGSFGYSSTTPPTVKELCVLLSMRVWKRKDTIYGVSGSADLGTLSVISQLGRDDEIQRLFNAIPKRVTA